METAIMLPVLTLLTLGTIEACSMIFLQQSLEIAAYEGARTAIVPKSKLGNVQFTSNNILTTRGVVGGTVSVSPANFDTAPYGTIVRVSVSAPCDANSLFPSWFYGGQTLTGNVDMMIED